MTFLQLSPILRGIFCTVAILFCVVNFSLIVEFFLHRKYKKCILAGISFLCAYFLFHLCAEVSDALLGGQLNEIAKRASGLSCIFYLLVYAAIAIICILQLLSEKHYRNQHITPMTIKEAIDELPVGVCYYHENGQPFLVNHKMSEIAYLLGGRALLDGNLFWDSIKEIGIGVLPNGRRYRFQRNELQIDDEVFIELLAQDVTQLYEKTEQLEIENERLRKNIVRMRAHSQEIEETIRREEILKSRVHIHDEMNRLLLATDKALHCASMKERLEIANTWKKNIFLLCQEAKEEPTNHLLTDLKELARLIGVNLVCDSVPQTHSSRALRLFVQVVQEGMTNAVKHAGAQTVFVDCKEDESVLILAITSDGSNPDKPIVLAGGLGTIKAQLEKMGGEFKVEMHPVFCLRVKIPMEE